EGNKKNMQVRGDLLIVVVTMLWGSCYLFIRMGLHTIEDFNLSALRFSVACICAGAGCCKRLKQIDFHTIRYAGLLAFLIFLPLSVVTLGINYTSISSTGFIFSLTVVFVPLLLAIFLKKIPDAKVVVGIILAVIGIGFLTLHNGISLNKGDILITLGALFY